MYRKLADFVSDYQTESQKTVATLNAIPTEFLTTKVDPLGMSLGEIAFHMTQAIEKITSQVGFEYSPSVLDQDVPQDTKSLVNAYEVTSNQLIEIIKSKTEDTFLEKTYSVYGSLWSVGQALSILVKHEIHHRAQIIIGLRIIGQSVPDIYGPARKS